MIPPEKDKHKNPSQRRPPWVYILIGIALGVIGASAGLYTVNEAYRLTFVSPVPLMLGAVGILLLMAALVPISMIPGDAGPMLRQKPDNPLIIQERVGDEWHDVLTVILPTSEATSVTTVPENSEIRPARRSSLLWVALVAVMTSLYSVFLARPPKEGKRS